MEPRMTALQLSRILDPEAPLVPKNGRLYPRTYQGVNNLLRAMAKPSPKHPKPSLKVKDFGIGQADWFMLTSTDVSNKSYPHEVAGADLFVKYYPYMEAWSYEPLLFFDPTSRKNVRADRGLKMKGKTYFFEVDRDTENIGVIQKKVDQYIQYGRETGERFHGIFDVVLDDITKTNLRSEEIGRYLETIHRGNQFCVAAHSRLTATQVDEPVIFTPSGQYSLADL